MNKRPRAARPVKPPSIAQPTLRYVPGYLPAQEADALLNWLLTTVAWQTEEIVLFGKRREVPRLVGWCGDEGLNYRYSNRAHRAAGWPAELARVRDRVADSMPQSPNFLLMNRYRSGQDAMGWHTDDEDLASDLIASISLGACRRFLVRTENGRPSRKIDLEHGSLLLMNRHRAHCLPRTRRPVGERVNLSFRVLS